jgi:hypothetical protein
VYVTFLSLLQYYPPLAGSGNDFSMTSPSQGILYHFLIVNFFGHGAAKGYFSIPGLSNIPGIDEGPSQCSKIIAASEQKIIELEAYCDTRTGTALFEPANHFFQPMVSPPLVLRGDTAPGGNSAAIALGGNDDGAGGYGSEQEIVN